MRMQICVKKSLFVSLSAEVSLPHFALFPLPGSPVCLFVFGDFVRFICRVVYVAVVVHVVVETFKIVVVFFNFC